MLFELPLGSKYFLTNWALLRVLRVVNFQVKPECSKLFETLVALRTLEHFVIGMNLKSYIIIIIIIHKNLWKVVLLGHFRIEIMPKIHDAWITKRIFSICCFVVRRLYICSILFSPYLIFTKHYCFWAISSTLSFILKISVKIDLVPANHTGGLFMIFLHYFP